MTRDGEIKTHGMRVAVTFEIDNCDNRAEADERLRLLEIQQGTDSGVHLVKVNYIKYTHTDVQI